MLCLYCQSECGPCPDDVEEVVCCTCAMGLGRVMVRELYNPDRLELLKKKLGWTWTDIAFKAGVSIAVLTKAREGEGFSPLLRRWINDQD